MGGEFGNQILPPAIGQAKVDDQKTSIATVAAGAGMVLLVLMFLLGKSAGKKKSAIVEIRRV